MTDAERSEWEERRRVSLLESWTLSERLRDRVVELLAFPLTQEVIEVSKDGKTSLTVVKPAGWNYSGLVSMAKLVVELQSAILAVALPWGEDLFDPETATIEEFRAYLARRGFSPGKSAV